MDIQKRKKQFNIFKNIKYLIVHVPSSRIKLVIQKCFNKKSSKVFLDVKNRLKNPLTSTKQSTRHIYFLKEREGKRDM